MSRIDHVIWDWNGTLVDDALLCVNIVNGILSEMNIPNVSFDYYRDNFSFPVRSYYEKIGLPIEEARYQKVSETFITEYRRLWKTCSLQYTPDGNYATFEDGIMTKYQMSLAFTELEPVFNSDYSENGIGQNEIGY